MSDSASAASRAGDVADAMKRLRDGAASLTRRPRSITLDALCQVLEDWRAPDSPYRKELVARLPEASGFHPAMLAKGLDLALSGWTGNALRGLVDSELGAPEAVARAAGFATTGVVLAGSIPMPSLLASMLPLLLHSPTLIKPASRDLVTPDLVVRSIRNVDPVLGRCIEVVAFTRQDEDASRAFFAAPCIDATGSDETLAEIEGQLDPRQRFVAHGHKTSIAVVGEQAEGTAEFDDLVRGLALDIALWDQLGCLSATQIFIVGRQARARAGILAAALSEELERAEALWPRGGIPPESAAEIARERSEVEMRRALGRDVELFSSAGTLHTVVLEEEASLRPSPLHRFVRVVPLASESALLETLRPIARHLQAAAIAGFGKGGEQLGDALLDIGASRICAPGRLQAPPLAWQRDNQPLLLSMVDHPDPSA